MIGSRSRTRCGPCARGNSLRSPKLPGLSRGKREWPETDMFWSISRGLLFTIAGSLLLIALFLAGFLWVLQRGPQETVVPDLVGMPLEKARDAAGACGLPIDIRTRAYSPTIPEGCITEMRPYANKRVKRGRKIEVTLSKGPKDVKVPDVKALDLANARETITAAKVIDARGKVEDLGKTSNEAAKGAATATQQAMKNAVDVSKDAASAVVRLPNTRLIEMRERCDKAPNGAPDCAAAAANGCRAKGFTGGTSLDVTTAVTCPTPAELARQKPQQIECPVETVVTRAVCQ